MCNLSIKFIILEKMIYLQKYFNIKISNSYYNYCDIIKAMILAVKYAIYKNVVSEVSATKPSMSPVMPPIFCSMLFFTFKKTINDNTVLIINTSMMNSYFKNMKVTSNDMIINELNTHIIVDVAILPINILPIPLSFG